MTTSTRPTELETQDIHALAQFLERQVRAHWQITLEQNRDKLADAYARAGDMAYGTYLGLLFRPLARVLEAAGLKASPPLPGPLERSREWGANPEGTDQQRWMWTTLFRADGSALGTLVTAVFHDHTTFAVPRAPHVFGLNAVGHEAVIEALSRRSSDFAQARDFETEVAEYLKTQQG